MIGKTDKYMKIFSIVLNSRNRPKLLDGLLYSILISTQKIDNLEVLIRFDDDDPSLNLNKSIVSKYSFVKPFFGNHITSGSVSLNILAHKSVGKYIWVLNDDCVIQTKYWDYHTYELLKGHNKDICYIHTRDNSCDKLNHKKYSSFPMISRQALNKLGYFINERFVGLGGDVHLYRVFESANMVVHSNINIDHVMHRTPRDVSSPDQTAVEMRQNTRDHFINCWSCDITEDVKRLVY